jgi:hypothetical protein
MAPTHKKSARYYEASGRGEWIRTTDLLVPNQEDEENE